MTTNVYWIFLEQLRREGSTNMYGAVPNLMREFPKLNREEAASILIDWMQNYAPEDYVGLETGD